MHTRTQIAAEIYAETAHTLAELVLNQRRAYMRRGRQNSRRDTAVGRPVFQWSCSPTCSAVF